MSDLCFGPPRIELRLHDRQAGPAMLDEAAADPRQSRFRRGGTRRVVDDHGVVVHVRHGPTLVAVHALGEDADDEGLEVHHEIPAHQGMVDPRQQQQARRLDRPRRDDHVPGVDAPGGTVGADDFDAGGTAPVGAQTRHEGLGQQLGVSPRPWRASTGPRDRPWRGWDIRRRRRTRSCCTPDARRRGPSSRRWARRTDAGPAPRPPRSNAARRTWARPTAWDRGPSATPRTGLAPASPATPMDVRPRRRRARGRRRRSASRPPRHPRRDRGCSTGAKSSSRKRGTLPSAWVPPPPTVVGMELTSPT